MSAVPPAAGWRSILRSDLMPRYIVLLGGIWLHAASTLIAATTLPSAVAAIGGAELVSWAFALYQLGSIVAGAATALVVARFGLRAAFQLAIALYGVGCVACAVAPAMEPLLLGRLIQGAGGGGLLALSYVALNRMFPRAMMPHLVAMISAFWTLSALCGPLIGGGFAGLGIWRAAFWAFAAQSVLLAIAVHRLVPAGERAPEKPAPVPLARLAVLTVAIAAVGYASVASDAIASALGCGLGVALLVPFLAMDRRSGRARMYPARAVDPRSAIGSGLALTFLCAAASESFLIYGPFLLQSRMGLGPLTAGYVLVLEEFGWGGAAIAFATVGAATERWLIRIGPVVIAASLAGFAIAFSSGSFWAVVALAFAQGAGFGMMWGFVIRRVVSAARGSDRDRASSALPVTQQIGFALGAAASGVVANATGLLERGPPGGVDAAFWTFAAFVPLALAGAAAGWQMTRRA